MHAHEGAFAVRLMSRVLKVSPSGYYAWRGRVQSLFRTAKYRHGYPVEGFADLDHARRWAVDFVHGYNTDHRHSGIRFVAPAQRHVGEDHALLQSRDALYQAARDRCPRRWSGPTRNWDPIRVVTLNPERCDSFTVTARKAVA